MMSTSHLRWLALAVSLTAVGGCIEEQLGGAKHLQPLSYATERELEEKGMRKSDPIVVRIFKEESELEIWKPGADGRYAFFKSYEICKWSGELGPKKKEGDRQAPEGFYTVAPGQMNPNSSYYLSFNIGYPNSFDRSHGRTGKHLMVHGACSSAGCYAMSDEVIAEVYTLARDAFRGGQRGFQVQAYPFRMTPKNLANHAGNKNMAFWRKLKEGSDHFEVTGKPPRVGVCNRDYVFNANPVDPSKKLNPSARCPLLDIPDNIEVAVANKQIRDETAYQVAVAEIKLQEQMQQAPDGQSDRIMTASIKEQGSASGYSSDADASRVLGDKKPATAAKDATTADTETSDTQIATAAATESPVQVAPSSVATAFSGVWGKLVNFTGLGALGGADGAEAGAGQPESEGDPVTTGSVPTPTKKPLDKNALAVDELPQLTSATAFVTIILNDDPFAIFDMFETVDGVSVPADIVRR